MAITITSVFAGKNRLRYLLSTAGIDTGVITTTGAATPDVSTDLGASNGALKQITKAVAQGYGLLPAGAKVQGEARALYLSDGASLVSTLQNIPTAQATITPRSGAQEWALDADVSGGNPTITVAAVLAAAATAYLDIFIPGAIGA